MLFRSRRPALSEGLEQYRNTSGAVLLDVRTPEEYRDGHLPGAKNLPLDRLDTIAEPAGSPLFVYCRSGARSAQARAWACASEAFVSACLTAICWALKSAGTMIAP